SIRQPLAGTRQLDGPLRTARRGGFAVPVGRLLWLLGYDLKNFVEPKLARLAVDDLELPDCHVGFYGSLVVFDHLLGKTWIVSTGLDADGSRDDGQARRQSEFWRNLLETDIVAGFSLRPQAQLEGGGDDTEARVVSNSSRADFIEAVERARRYIRAGDIYQVNLSQRLAAPCPL